MGFEESRRHVLREIELFQDLSDEELAKVSDLCVEHRYPKGTYIFMEGDEREAVYFIRRGLVKVFKVDEEGREHIVTVLGKGQMFPHVGFFDDAPYPGTAQAMEESTLLMIRRSQFDALLMSQPAIMRKVMHVMGQKILMLQAKLQELALFDAHDRVVALIRHFAEEHGQPEADGIHIRLPVTHGEMAQMIGMTRESVNRVWSQLRRSGVLSGERDEWVVHFDRL
ncbi:MAG: Crp/Fnr family transcriptional regulator [Alicyclobacillus herbarius]|uniref:Crp/Fnr family transcriptional regulator n=1 Tax=Alicyclobacillus herbarius TaxID=122960 RepID=UPI00041FF1A1|nr:Crp/Fnr family transcriptional regulator [Alicyclobacillus herbarius]MCL6631465.1 Crp/Fnr family transcriptional regulator [Alicyclobacillus herbarius]